MRAQDAGGKQICYAFNSPHEWCPGGCGREHVCGKCFKQNKPMYMCSHKGDGAKPASTF